MDCKYVHEAGVIEQYLTGKLTPADRDAFEEHFFTCPRCFEQLETCRAVRDELAAASKEIGAEAAAQTSARRWGWVAAAALAGLALVIGLWWFSTSLPEPKTPPVALKPVPGAQPQTTPPSSPVPSLAELARVEPPAYVPVMLRGQEGEAAQQFRQAMEHYVRGDYRSALRGLEEAATLDADSPRISFYLAACYLLTDQTDAAIGGFQRTIAMADTPYLEEAHFYLAKAFLRNGDLHSAQDQLRKTMQLGGELRTEAQDLLRRVEALRAQGR